jgi:predicted P-loop ATPase
MKKVNLTTSVKKTKTQAPAIAGAEIVDVSQVVQSAENSAASAEEVTVTEKLPNLVVIEKFLKTHYSFRYNLVTSRIEFRAIKASEFELLNDYKLNSIYRNIRLNRIQTNLGELRSIINSDFIRQYDPFLSYFKSLQPWDNTTDFIEQYSSLVKSTNDVLFKKCFKKWLVAMVACAIEPNVVNHTVLVFSGKQGVGKTTFLMNLIPKQLQNYVFSGSINPSSKDSMIQLSECLLINMDELETMSKSQVGELKELITKGAIRTRRAYGFNIENLVRRASFSGSVNDKQFLNDASGNRRFLCFEILEIDYKTIYDLNLMYSQAYSLFKNGFKYWFDGPEIDEITLHNEEFQSLTFEEELLLKFYEAIPENESKLFLSTTDIASNLAEHQKFNITNSFKQNLGKALHKHKFARVKKNGRYVYALKNKSIPLSTSFSLAGVQEN